MIFIAKSLYIPNICSTFAAILWGNEYEKEMDGNRDGDYDEPIRVGAGERLAW